MTPAKRTLSHLRRILRRAVLGAKDLDTALTIGELLGKINFLNNDGLLAEEALEQAMFQRYGASLAVGAPAQPSSEIEWLHVISEAYSFGGHTRLLSKLLAAQRRAGDEAAVAVTRHSHPSFLDQIHAADAAVYELTGAPSMRAAQVLAQGRSAKRILLYIHPDDLGTALAARQLRAEGRQVLFVNHADHAFTYGVGAADLCLEVSGYGWRLSEARRPAHARHFLGIPVTDSEEELPRSQHSPRTGPLFSMGSSDKYKPGGGYDFPSFISDILDRTGASVEIVGPTLSDPWWSAAIARHGERLQLLGPRPFAETAVRLAAAACYIDSFPRNGGTAFPQALLAGKTVFGPGPDAGGYNLADALRFPSLEAMSESLVKFLETRLPLEGEQDIRDRILTEFNADAITKGLRAAVEGRPVPPPAEILAAPRSIDWYPQIWHAEGMVELPLKKHRLSLVGLRTRLSMALHFIGRDYIQGAPDSHWAILRWVFKG